MTAPPNGRQNRAMTPAPDLAPPTPPAARGAIPPQVVALHVNGAPRSATVRPYDVLLDVLREDLNLTGTKRGCDMGTCGCCTVLVDGAPPLLPDARAGGDRARDHDDRGPAARRGAPSGAAVLRRDRRRAVRLLHAGLHHDRRAPARHQSRARRGRDPRGHLGEHLPLHGLREDHRRPSSAPPPRARRPAAESADERAHAGAPAAALPSRRRTGGRQAGPAGRRARARSPARPSTPTTSSSPGCSSARSCGARSPTRASSRIDTSRAEAMPGVRAVVTGRESSGRSACCRSRRTRPRWRSTTSATSATASRRRRRRRGDRARGAPADRRRRTELPADPLDRGRAQADRRSRSTPKTARRHQPPQGGRAELRRRRRRRSQQAAFVREAPVPVRRRHPRLHRAALRDRPLRRRRPPAHLVGDAGAALPAPRAGEVMEMPMHRIRVIRPMVGGAFGGK